MNAELVPSDKPDRTSFEHQIQKTNLFFFQNQLCSLTVSSIHRLTLFKVSACSSKNIFFVVDWHIAQAIDRSDTLCCEQSSDDIVYVVIVLNDCSKNHFEREIYVKMLMLPH